MDNEWMASGLCRVEPPSRFFPSDGVGVEIAKRICAECPVKHPCLEYALENRIDHGVWGGTSERQRRTDPQEAQDRRTSAGLNARHKRCEPPCAAAGGSSREPSRPIGATAVVRVGQDDRGGDRVQALVSSSFLSSLPWRPFRTRLGRAQRAGELGSLVPPKISKMTMAMMISSVVPGMEPEGTPPAAGPTRGEAERVIECVVNISEGRRRDVIEAIAGGRGADLLDVHVDADHHRRVLTAGRRGGGPAAGRRGRRAGSTCATTTAPTPASGSSTWCRSWPSATRRHRPTPSPPATASPRGPADELGVPVLPLRPRAHPARACAGVPSRRSRPTPARPSRIPPPGPSRSGARPVLVAYNLWLAEPDLARPAASPGRPRPGGARPGAGRGRRGAGVDEPDRPGPGRARPRSMTRWPRRRPRSSRAELVGLVPRRGAATRSTRQAGNELDLAAIGRSRPGSRRGPASRPGRSSSQAAGCGAGEGPLAADAATLALAHPAPDAELLAVRQGVLEAVLTDDAASADLLGLPRGRPTLGEEQVRIDAEAVGVVLP